MDYWYITGTGSGLGKALAERALEREDRFITGMSRHQPVVHPRYTHLPMDLTNLRLLGDFHFTIPQDARALVLVNNAGSIGEMRYTGSLDASGIAPVYLLNCVAPHLLANAFIRDAGAMACRKILINIISGASTDPYDGWSEYCASKAALEMLSRCIAREQELSGGNVIVWAIAPGVMDTAMQDKIRRSDIKDFSRKKKFTDLKENNALRPVAEVADAILRMADHPEQFAAIIHNLKM